MAHLGSFTTNSPINKAVLARTLFTCPVACCPNWSMPALGCGGAATAPPMHCNDLACRNACGGGGWCIGPKVQTKPARFSFKNSRCQIFWKIFWGPSWKYTQQAKKGSLNDASRFSPWILRDAKLAWFCWSILVPKYNELTYGRWCVGGIHSIYNFPSWKHDVAS